MVTSLNHNIVHVPIWVVVWWRTNTLCQCCTWIQQWHWCNGNQSRDWKTYHTYHIDRIQKKQLHQPERLLNILDASRLLQQLHSWSAGEWLDLVLVDASGLMGIAAIYELNTISIRSPGAELPALAARISWLRGFTALPLRGPPWQRIRMTTSCRTACGRKKSWIPLWWRPPVLAWSFCSQVRNDPFPRNSDVVTLSIFKPCLKSSAFCHCSLLECLIVVDKPSDRLKISL